MSHTQTTTSRTAAITARDWFAWQQMTPAEQDQFLADLHYTMHAAPDDLGYVPTDDDIAQNAGPTLVDICHDTSSDSERGNEGTIECWPVEATVNSPQWSQVA